jgi:hypothetical protein
MSAGTIVFVLSLAAIGLIPAQARASDPVIWVADSRQGAAIIGAGLIDALMAERENNRTQPIIYERQGISPSRGTAATAQAGGIVVWKGSFEASFLGRPVQDFTDWHGMPVRRDSMLTVKMVNGSFCYPSGSKCFIDADRNGSWDGAGRKPSGRPLDVPYEVIEVRKEKPDATATECRLARIHDGVAELAEVVLLGDSTSAAATRCEVRVGGEPCSCGGARITAGDQRDRDGLSRGSLKARTDSTGTNRHLTRAEGSWSVRSRSR